MMHPFIKCTFFSINAHCTLLLLADIMSEAVLSKVFMGYWVNLITTFNLSNIPETSQENMNNELIDSGVYLMAAEFNRKAYYNTTECINRIWRSYFKSNPVLSKRENLKNVEWKTREYKHKRGYGYEYEIIYVLKFEVEVSLENSGSVLLPKFPSNFRDILIDFLADIKVLMCRSKIGLQEAQSKKDDFVEEVDKELNFGISGPIKYNESN